MHYTTKQWGTTPKDVDSAVTARVPVYLSKDNRYFQDKLRYIITGKNRKSNKWKVPYSVLKKYGYKSLVNEYYKNI